jgi:hypothetical protein
MIGIALAMAAFASMGYSESQSEGNAIRRATSQSGKGISCKAYQRISRKRKNRTKYKRMVRAGR